MSYDLIVIGSGPGGYVAAIRAAQLGMKVAVVEKENLGGVCLNWGCIPTKALLKSAHVFLEAKHSLDYGVVANNVMPDFQAMIKRSRNVAEGMSKGIRFLFKKNKIEIIEGFGSLVANDTVEVKNKGSFKAAHIVLATGARSRELPGIKQDGKKIIGYREALTLPKQPDSMVVIGSGAIGSELAYFYHSIGTKVTLVEYMPAIVPNEDEEISKALESIFRKNGMNVMTNASVEKVDTSADKLCRITVKTNKGEETIDAEIVLSAVGITPNIENIGLEKLNIAHENGKIKVDEFFRTNVKGVYAIGDIVHGQALAHVASAEGIACVEKIAGLNPHPIDYSNIPGCIYTSPEIASVGLTEKKAVEKGLDIKIGKFPYSASGKANACGNKDGFVKLIFDAKYGELIGAHLMGANVTEMISGLVIGRKLEITGEELLKTVHPHPTMSEAIMEAAAAAYDEVIHL